MRRSGPPQRRAPLRAGKPLTAKTGLNTTRGLGGRSRPAQALKRPLEPGEAEWKTRKSSGTCAACRRRGPVVWHHLVDKNLVRRVTTAEQHAAGVCWDPRNALIVGAPMPWGGKCRCHDRHSQPHRDDDKLDFKLVGAAAQQYAVEVLGEGPAIEYWRRRYRGAP